MQCLATEYSEWTEATVAIPSAKPRESPAVALCANNANGCVASTHASVGGKYALQLNFAVEATYAGVAFEFLNRNVADPVQSNTRCGVTFENMVAADAIGLPSPHAAGVYIVNPANSATTAASYGLWDLTRSYSSGGGLNGIRTVSYTLADFNSALSNCGWKRIEDNTALTVFETTVRITTVQQGRSIRGTLYTTTRETTIVLGFAFQTAVSASATVETQSTVTTEASVLHQFVDPANQRAYLVLYTSSQGPYQLALATATEAPVCTAASGGCADWAAGSNANGPASAMRALLASDLAPPITATLPTGVTAGKSTRTAECFDPNNVAADYSATSNSGAVTYAPCGQYWLISLNPAREALYQVAATAQRALASSPNARPAQCADTFGAHVARTFTGSWSATFNVTCHPSFKGACASARPGANVQQPVTVSFSSASDDYCPRIIDSLSSSAKLELFDNFARTSAQSQFVFGTSSYFLLTITSSVPMTDVRAEEVSVTQGYAVANHDSTYASPSSTWLRPSAAALSASPRQVLWAYAMNTAVANQDTYFGAVPLAASGCVHASGLDQTPTPGARAESERWTGPAGDTAYVAADYVASTCQFKANATDTGVGQWWIQQYRKASAAGVQGALSAYVPFEFYWDSRVSGANGDFAETTTVRVDARVRYQDQATKRHARVGAWLTPINALDTAAGDSLTASARLTVGGQGSPSSPGVTSTASTGLVIIVAVAAGAAVLAVAAAVVLLAVHKRRLQSLKANNLESIELNVVTADTTLATAGGASAEAGEPDPEAPHQLEGARSTDNLLTMS